MNELPITKGLGMKVRTFQVLCFIVAIGLVAPNAIVTANIDEQPPPSLAPSAMSDSVPQRESLLSKIRRPISMLKNRKLMSTVKRGMRQSWRTSFRNAGY
jgi:hypothetical protein